jgi:hypothetical protein
MVAMPRPPALVLAAAVVAASAAAAGCTSTQHTEPAGPQPDLWVRELDLSPRRGEVGAPFEARLTWRDNYIREPELSVSGLPPGLTFDPAGRKVTGTPTQAGFFTVNIAVRKKPPTEKTHRPGPDERWWPETVELEIFDPVEPREAQPAPGGRRK